VSSIQSLIAFFKREPLATAALVGVITGLFLSLRPVFQEAVDTFIIIVMAYLISDLISAFIITGGKGIVQIPATGSTKTHHKSTAFVILFASIPLAGIIIDWISYQLLGFFAIETATLLGCIIVGLVLAALVYLDLEVKFYRR
jgi:hypothetical protein